MKEILLNLEKEIHSREIQRYEIKRNQYEINKHLKAIETDTAIKIYKAVDPVSHKSKYTTETQRKVAVDKMLEMDTEYSQLLDKDHELTMNWSLLGSEIEHYKRLFEIERISWITQKTGAGIE